MGNRFRLRISRIIPIMPLQPCGSKDHSHDPINPIPEPNQKKPRRYSSIRRHVSSAFASCGITGRSKPALSYAYGELDRTESEPRPPQPKKIDCFSKWEKEEKYWQVVEITETPRRKIYYSSADENDVVFPPPPPPPSSSENDTKRRVKQRKKSRSARRVSTSSSVESGLFTSSETFDDDDETETLVSSSRSLSTADSSSPRRSKRNKKKKKKKKRAVAAESCTAAARLSVFQRMIPCRVDGKVRESFAVVKRSEDPYEDFKRSMMEMILEKQMFDDDDLELLLHCFLSLNSKNHHGLIVRAFFEIWEALFCGPLRSTSTVSSSSSSTRRLSSAL